MTAGSGEHAAPSVPRVAVIGGGITGLAAALRLRERLGERADVILVDQASRLGGKLRTGETGGQLLEEGAESFLVRDQDGETSAAVSLARRVGLGDALRHPAPVPAALAVDGRLAPIPRGTLMGVPQQGSDLDGVAELAVGADHDGGRPLLLHNEDVSVGGLVRQRLGDQVVDRLVDPLLGGVYAGRADDLSLAATVPALAAACRASSTLSDAVRAALRRRSAGPGPVFATVEGGMSRLVGAVARAANARLYLGFPVRELGRTHSGWRLTVGSTHDPQTIEATAIVLAVPAAPAARLLTSVSPAAADEIARLAYASVGLVTLALPADRVTLPALSGFLVPASEGYAVKALTIFNVKWPHLETGGLALLRASVGRYREEAPLQRSDEELVALVRRELGELLPGGPLPEPVAAGVHRWGGALPQYAPGHLERVARARAALAADSMALSGESLALAGAAYDGVGIPACVNSGEAAAEQVADALKGWSS
jgi:oxygen-dependent protoporphyrinogen oxidase